MVIVADGDVWCSLLKGYIPIQKLKAGDGVVGKRYGQCVRAVLKPQAV